MKKKPIVIDTHNQGPIIYTPKIMSLVKTMISQGYLPVDVIDEVNRITLSLESRNEFPEFRDSWTKSGVDVVCASIGNFSNPTMKYHKVKTDIQRYYNSATYGKFLKICKNIKDLDDVILFSKKGIIFMIEDISFVGDDLKEIYHLYDLGVRIFQITYNNGNQFGSGCFDCHDYGLTKRGHKLINLLNKLNLFVDFSHCSPLTTMEGIKAANNPICSHSFCYSLNKNPRGKTDIILKEIKKKNGFFGVLILPSLIGGNESEILDKFVDHIIYACKIAGIKNIGIGTDWAGTMPQEIVNIFTLIDKEKSPQYQYIDWNKNIPEYSSFSDWNIFITKLKNKGLNKDEIQKITGLNFFENFERLSI